MIRQNNGGVAKHIATIREQLGLGPRAMARALGVSMSTIYRWEKNGRVHPIYLDRMRQLVEASRAPSK